MWIQSVQCRLPQINILSFECIKTSSVEEKTDVDIMCGHTLLPVTHNSCVLHCRLLPQLTTGHISSVKYMTHKRVFSGICMIKL